MRILSTIVASALAISPALADAQQKKKAGSRSGKEVYDASCAMCHTNGLMNAPKITETARWGLLAKKGVQQLTDNTIKGTGSMPPNGTDRSATPAEIGAAVKYMVDSAKR
jgi:cytochrome c5